MLDRGAKKDTICTVYTWIPRAFSQFRGHGTFIASGAFQDEADNVPVEGFGDPFVDVTKSNGI